MKDKKSLALLKDIEQLESRSAYFWVKNQNGEVPNLLKSIETIPEYRLDTICLTDEEKSILNKALPLMIAIETYAKLGFRNFIIYEELGESSYPDIDLELAALTLSPTSKKHRTEDYSKLTDEELEHRQVAYSKIL